MRGSRRTDCPLRVVRHETLGRPERLHAVCRIRVPSLRHERVSRRLNRLLGDGGHVQPVASGRGFGGGCIRVADSQEGLR